MKVFYINPMSYNNSAIYDYSLLSNISGEFEIVFFCSVYYDAKGIDNVYFKPIFKYNKISSKALKLISYVFSLLKLIYYIILDRPNIIHIQWIRVPVIDILLLKLCRLLKVKTVYTAHNVLPHNCDSKSEELRYKEYYHTTDYIITHTNISKIELIEKFNLLDKKIKVIPHGLVQIEYNKENVEEIRKSFSVENELTEKLVFSSIGLQSPYKGIGNLIDVWAETPDLRNNENTHLILAGRFCDVDYSKIEDLNNVTIINRFISDDEYIALSHLSDVILLPYVKISQSGVLLSALNERIPVLVSHVGGLYEPLRISDIGWDMGSPTKENLKKHLIEIISSPQLIKNIKTDNDRWRKIEDYYSWKNIGRKTVDLYSLIENLIEKNN